MRIKKIFTNISNITFSASSVSFYLIINGGSTVFLLISIISIFINKLSINIPDENLKNIIDSLISYNKNYTFSIILFITSVYSTSTLFKSYLKGTEIITNTKYINNNYLKQLEDIKIRVPKGYRDVIKNLAKEEGYDGVNPFVINLVNGVLREKGREEIPTGVKETKAKW